MSLIKFNNQEKIFKVNLLIDSIYNHVIIKFNDETDIIDDILLNGFKELNEHNYIIQSDFSDMKYIYRIKEDGLTYILTNDENDIYTKSDTGNISGEMEEYIPTLEDVKNNKITELLSICNSMIIHGVDVEIDGNVEHFSYTDEDQVNVKEIFDLSIQTNVPMYYHADGESCKLYTVEQIANIYSSLATNKMHHITYFNQLKMYVQSLDDIDIVNAVAYGDELTGSYLDTYNAAMEQAKAGISALFTLNTVEG